MLAGSSAHTPPRHIPSVGRMRRVAVPTCRAVSLLMARPMPPTIPPIHASPQRMSATTPPTMPAKRVEIASASVRMTTASSERNAMNSSGRGGTYPTTRSTMKSCSAVVGSAYTRIVMTTPSHFPTTNSAREIGRASIASAVPDSTSPDSAGAPANTAENASVKLNMKPTRMSSCETTATCCTRVIGGSPFVVIWLKPHDVNATTRSVSPRSTRNSRRRSISRTVRRAMVRISI
jgi:hypothetical protein